MRHDEPILATIQSAAVTFVEQPFDTPLQLSSGAITHLTEARASVTVEVDGATAIGHGSIYLSDLWAWPDPAFTHAQRDDAMRELCVTIAKNLMSWCGHRADHPLVLGLRLHDTLEHLTASPPLLARLLCGSPFDAALHDAVGKALNRSAFDLYECNQPIPEADALLDGDASSAIRQLLSQPPRTMLDAWWIMMPGHPLPPIVTQRGYTGFKLKIMGRDTDADVAQTVDAFHAARAAGVSSPQLIVDSNEAHRDADAVLDYLSTLRAVDADAFESLMYLEQPTNRDLRASPQDWRAVTKLKPVLVDEALTTFAAFDDIASQGWSGLAIKTCKGHSFALVAAAWAKKQGMTIALADLTNPGVSAIHAALFAAHVPTINGCELNSPQFTPRANDPWHARWQGLFDVQNGAHHLHDPHIVGLGSQM